MIFEPEDFIARPAALVPKPRATVPGQAKARPLSAHDLERLVPDGRIDRPPGHGPGAQQCHCDGAADMVNPRAHGRILLRTMARVITVNRKNSRDEAAVDPADPSRAPLPELAGHLMRRLAILVRFDTSLPSDIDGNGPVDHLSFR